MEEMGKTSQGKLQSWGVIFTSYSGYCFKSETIKTKEFLSIEQNHIHYIQTFPDCLIRTGSQNEHDEFLQLLFINSDFKASWIPPFSFQQGFFTAPAIMFKESKVHFENTINIPICSDLWTAYSSFWKGNKEETEISIQMCVIYTSTRLLYYPTKVLSAET